MYSLANWHSYEGHTPAERRDIYAQQKNDYDRPKGTLILALPYPYYDDGTSDYHLILSNWHTALNDLSPYVHSYSRSDGCIYVHATAEAIAAANEIITALENYPVLDDEDFSNREYEAAYTYWNETAYQYDVLKGLPEAWYEFLTNTDNPDTASIREEVEEVAFQAAFENTSYSDGPDVDSAILAIHAYVHHLRRLWYHYNIESIPGQGTFSLPA